MKKLLAWALILMLCGCALAEGAAVPGNNLGFKVLARIADGTQNQFISPLSLAFALSMAAAGAEGETKAELLAALGAEDARDIAVLSESLRESGLSLANAAFVQPVLTLNPDYQAALNAFEAKCFPLGDVGPVNDWAREQTDGLIDPLIQQISEDTRLLLINALAMDAEWWHKFDSASTYADDFHAPDGDIQVDFMHETYEYPDYGEIDGMQVIRLGYRDSAMEMILALPEEGRLPEALEALGERGLAALDYEPMDCRVALALPRLDISVTNPLSDSLQALGVQKAFDDLAADFSGIGDLPLKIDEVLQKLRVQVDEEGTKAAAATIIIMAEGGAAPFEEPRPLVRMELNRPFIMVIADGTTGAAAFAGVVAWPEAAALGEREKQVEW